MSKIKKIRVLNVISTFDINGGLQNYVYNLLKGLNLNLFQLDVLAFNWHHCDSTCDKYIELFDKAGIKTYSVCNPSKNIFKFMSEVKHFMKTHKYDIVHVHTLALAWYFLFQALKNNVKCRIFHAHETKLSDNMIHRIRNALFFPLSKLFATDYAAVSSEAAKALFKNKNVSIIYPAIPYKKFIYSSVFRDLWRKKLKLKDSDFVIGFVGRFCKAKNIKFALKTLWEIKNKEKKIKFVICGEGEQKKLYHKLIKKWKLQDHVIFVKPLLNVNELYSAFDCFIMPSKHEGLGIVAVEAQYNGLITLVSKNTPRVVDVGNCMFLPLSRNVWRNEIIRLKKDHKRKFTIDKNYFTSEKCSHKILSFYKGCYNKVNEL